ncbi:MAG: phosphatase PAP2 family protein [Saprospiraceae bacterium]|nr:phosphatase PAP2 family protein [Saprospiraceae bacterium]
MLDSILQFDLDLFKILNNNWHSPFLDWLLPLWRDKYFWIPAYILLTAWLLLRYRLKGLWCLLALVICVGLTDTLSHRVIKKQVQRPRPCKVLNQDAGEIRLLIKCGSGYSFTSNHAANHFGIATFLFFLFFGKAPRWRWILFLWAASISYAQVYVGVHYPLDVFAGAILGFLVGWSVAWVFRSKIGFPDQIPTA